MCLTIKTKLKKYRQLNQNSNDLIGSQTQIFNIFNILFCTGNVEENNLGPGGDKALFVTSGGTLEIHGKPKVSWTKLAQTAPKYDEVADTVVEQVVCTYKSNSNRLTSSVHRALVHQTPQRD